MGTERGFINFCLQKLLSDNKCFFSWRCQGSYPGMLKNRTFRVVLVKDGLGVGETRTDPEQCKTVKYSGKTVSIKL